MANRVTVPVTNFESLSPPWSLTSLDNNFLALQGALNDSSLGYVITGTDTGSANHYNIATPAFGMPSAYQAGMTVVFSPAAINSSGSCTLAVGGLSAQSLQLSGGLVPFGYFVPGAYYMATYSGTSFQVVGSSLAPVSVFNNSPGVTVNVSGAYATSLSVLVIWSSAISTTINLNQLQYGIPISITLFNSSGGSVSYKLVATDPLANSLNIWATFPLNASGSAATSLTIVNTLTAGSTITYVGVTNSTLYLNA